MLAQKIEKNLLYNFCTFGKFYFIYFYNSQLKLVFIVFTNANTNMCLTLTKYLLKYLINQFEIYYFLKTVILTYF